MIVNSTLQTETTDTALVGRTLDGDPDAFEHIVSRYQSLICSLTYSATGSLGQSQDLAQETFITAWKHLRLLRERHKLRAWLCGIARGLIGKALRRDGREPIHEAEPLDAVLESADVGPLPYERVISQEEEAILWRSLERIPEIYREPLVLFYREHQSVETVAVSLDLNEDAVKQRLSRGRKLLQQEVLSFIESALERSSPGKAFTLGVLAALPVFVSSATSMEGASSEKERGFIKRFYDLLAIFIIVALGIVLLAVSARSVAVSHPALFSGVLLGFANGWIPATALLILWIRRKVRELNASGSHLQTGAALKAATVIEYRTKTCLVGLPLIHIRLGATWTGQREAVKAWIAIADDVAIGVIFAFGGMAIAPIGVGGFALGGIVFGGFGAGILCYAGFGIGAWVVGGVVTGLLAVGGCAFGWKAAIGGVAIAHQFALGSVTVAPHANDALANMLVKNNAFFQNAFLLVTRWLWPTLLLSLLPSLLIWRATKKSASSQR